MLMTPVLPVNASAVERMAKYEELKVEFEASCLKVLKKRTSNVLQSGKSGALLQTKGGNEGFGHMADPQPLELKQPYGEKEAVKVVDDVYGGQSAFGGATLSVQDCATFNSREGGVIESVYGELTPHGVVKMLRAANAMPGARYYDIGAGTGKTVILAWLLGYHAAGIELSEARWWESCKRLAKLRKLRDSGSGLFMNENDELELVNGSFDSFDFSDGDLIFINNVMWSDTTMSTLEKSLATLHAGARIVTAKPLSGPRFALRSTITLETSWADHGHHYQIYERVGNASNTQGLFSSHVEACS